MTCTFDPLAHDIAALGMFHCPDCGEMVLAGFPHPDYSLLDDPDFGPGGDGAPDMDTPAPVDPALGF